MLFSRISAVFTLAIVAHAQTSTLPPSASPTTTFSLSPAESTKAAHNLENYLSSLTTQPGYSAAASVLETAVPYSVSRQILDDPSGYWNNIATASALPSWYTAMPTSVQAFWSSVGVQEISIVTKAAAGPTNAAKVAGAVLAAGGAVVAML